MGKPSDRAASALRREAEAALRLQVEGHHEEAIALADGLAARHEGSALVLHLAGLLHHAVSRRTDQEATAQHHVRAALGYLARAKRLVPNCVSISDHLARALFMAAKADEAENEAREAVDMASPVDPADNNVAYAVGGGLRSTRDQRVLSCRLAALDTLTSIQHWRLHHLVTDVLDLHDAADDGHRHHGARAREAVKKAKDLAKRYPCSARAQLLSAHTQLLRLRALDPDMDRRPILSHIRLAVKETIADTFGGSLMLAMFHAKLCFVLGLYEASHLECARAFAIPEPADPMWEDVPPHSVQGDTFDDRVLSVDEELGRLLDKLFLVAHDFRCSMTSEKQSGFVSVRLLDLQEYYGKEYEGYQWAARTISDALSFANNNRSWRFWICPFCAGIKLPNPESLLEHMNCKHMRKLRSVFGSKLSEYVILDDSLDEITVYQDSEGHHCLRFNNTEYVFARLSVPTQEMSIAGILEKKCERGKEILEEIKHKLKRLAANKLSAEFDKARPEIQDLWHAFVRTSFLDYRIVIKTFAKPFIWTKLLQSLSEDKAASKICNADIDVIFPNVVDACEVHAEDNVGKSDVQSVATVLRYLPSITNENSASNLLGSCSQYSEETTSISIYRKSIEVIDKDTDGIFILNFIIQILWNWRGFRDEFLKRQPVCSLPSHEGPCISQMLYDIFSGWQKNDHHNTYSLISLRDKICEVLNDSTLFQNVKVNTSYYIITTILKALRMPQVFLEVNSPVERKNFETLRQPANQAKVLCNKDIICEGFGIKESTTCGDKIDADSLQIAEVKSFADDKCRQVDPLSVSTPELSTLALYILLGERENQRTFREVINRMIYEPDLVLFRRQYTTPDTVKCTLASMVCA
nr:uncharacterized protein LOC127293643 isoform X1 [Lolium perenne]